MKNTSVVDFAQNGSNRRVDPMARYEGGVPHSVLCGERLITRPLPGWVCSEHLEHVCSTKRDHTCPRRPHGPKSPF
eukprot:3611116-Prymnesium_polylepis.1